VIRGYPTPERGSVWISVGQPEAIAVVYAVKVPPSGTYDDPYRGFNVYYYWFDKEDHSWGTCQLSEFKNLFVEARVYKRYLDPQPGPDPTFPLYEVKDSDV
jgi:hypothetical protein